MKCAKCKEEFLKTELVYNEFIEAFVCKECDADICETEQYYARLDED